MSIVLEHLTKRFGGHPVVNGVSLHFTRTGEGCFAAVTESDGEPLATRIEVSPRDSQT